MNANRLQLAVGDLICSTTSDYEVQHLLGSGTFGVVTKCKKLATNEMVAVKILKSKRYINEAKKEEMILKKMKEFDSHKFNIVRWNDSFAYMGHFCLEFEKLDISLDEFMQTCSNPLKLVEIRPIVQQLATALEFLMNIGIVHADLKLANIMLVEQFNQPLRVKIIDFGLASDNPRACTGLTLQTLWYRAPEVLLGCPINEAIDVWSLGCIAAEMLMGMALFPGSDEYDMMRHIFYTIGKPSDHLLFAGQYTGNFFRAKNRGSELPTWRFMSALEVRNFTCNQCTLFTLNQLEMVPEELSGEDASIDACERASFVDLLTRMLKVDASERITPSQILQHPYITMSHLVETFDNSDYVKTSVELMKACNDQSSDGDNATYATFKTCTLDYHSVPDEDHLAGLSSSEEPILNSTDDECGNRRPEPTVTKTKGDEFLEAVVTETGGQTSPRLSLLPKRKRDDADQCLTSDADSIAKERRSINVNEKLIVSFKKLLTKTEAWSSSTSVKPHERKKRVYEDDSDSKQEKTSS
ncbi:Homeodomain-interacting protein kinase 2 [Larimichthys crocea]|uniref:Homeodomain-interacting protein kinase 2 n=1 Tax=Larimichthys crocea TaxID=215358 RepID=A0A6G0IRP4_LARCR|nr:Homeodomain-interacting protein kinase 2 [Larimichthys crocea]